ncbi:MULTISPECIES: helix-turn-helix domain-containing protein [Brevundimonas]|uniref:helix-turn-helix domain-containing protein n=1 Tax=Brevundimonas TaxID=41275 RepID=UPI0025C66A5B|nr:MULTISPECIES: helix-turn-helix transcriptional regulator [Brevundimonas]
MTGRELLAWNLRALRTARGQSQEALAADTGLDRAYVSEIERGLGNASLDVLDRLAACFSVPVSELLREPDGGAAAPPPPLRPGRKPRAR